MPKRKLDRPNRKSDDLNQKIIINDRLVMIIGVQFFGFIIPNATGLISNADRSIIYLFGAYAYFIIISFLIWQGNRSLLFQLDKKYNWFIHPIQKIVLLLGANILYTGTLVVVMLYGWYTFNGLAVNWEVIRTSAIICIVCVVFISNAYETVILIKRRQSDLLNEERLERAKVQAELEALKNQIDPHFMFNSLNNLTHLIEKDPSKARVYTESLAEVYRYILINKAQKLVVLEDELTFLDKYIDLLGLRYEHALTIQFKIQALDRTRFLIPPASIFFALENVVKHNEISTKYPMQVDISKIENAIFIVNPIKIKRSIVHSSKIGLNNLNERFKLTTGQGIQTSKTNEQFQLKLPLLPIAS